MLHWLLMNTHPKKSTPEAIKYKMPVAVAFLATLSLTACSESSPSAASTSHSQIAAPSATRPSVEKKTPITTCTFTDKEKWTPTDSKFEAAFNLDAFTGPLGATKDQIRRGMTGQVHCEEGVTFDNIAMQNAVVTVEGIPPIDFPKIASACLAFLSVESPMSGPEAYNLGVLCPGETSASS